MEFAVEKQPSWNRIQLNNSFSFITDMDILQIDNDFLLVAFFVALTF